MDILKNDSLIHYSRAGDIFHYRWAVKRCLKLLDFDTDLAYITIEGSTESTLDGECIVDLAEYRQSKEGNKSVEYFQLKHSTVRSDDPFNISDLKETIENFANRFKALKNSKDNFLNIKLRILTNRMIAVSFKENIKKLMLGKTVNQNFLNTITKYTNLRDYELQEFCKCLCLDDSEGNYDEQKFDIHNELRKLIVSKNYSDREKLLVAKIWQKIEPGQSNIIKLEDMLEAFDVVDIRSFFPAPPLFEPIEHYIPREQQANIVKSIIATTTHTIITASGGMGKSALSSNIYKEFDNSFIVIPYDCYGNGSYRRISSKRHNPENAYTQIINTLAKAELCDQVIPSRNEPDEYWTKIFLNRISEACQTIKLQNEHAMLVIIFDAADNAVMIADEQNESCFVNILMKEIFPENCRIIFTCRPERLKLLDPTSTINYLRLNEFSIEETTKVLLNKFPSVTQDQAIEFNRLTSGNPRVQNNALSLNIASLNELLFSFGNTPATVENLIERQLEESINRIKDEFPKDYRTSIDNICTGLAILPPFVPISVLAKVSGVSEDVVISFITDLGHPLWKIDNTVQFRDEPTEKWFQDNYSTTPEKIYSFIKSIQSLSSEFSYVSEVLPILLLKAERFDDLVSLALSDNDLPSISEYDDNRLKVQRLQYAFKAALKINKNYEAVKLALLAGEEIAGNDRQNEILMKNIDLTISFLGQDRIQELAHRKEISGNWDGSATVYSASLLSSTSVLKGEAYNYLRSATHWLRRYFKTRDEVKDENEVFHEKLDDIEILELVFTHYRLNGIVKCVDFLLSWHPTSCIYRITSQFIARLIDTGKFDDIDLMANYGKGNASFIIAITAELMKVGRTPPKNCLTRCLNQIIQPQTRLDKPNEDFNDIFTNDAYLSFFEACTIHKLSIPSIRRGLNHYYNCPMLYRICDDFQYKNARENFLRYLSLQAVFKNNFTLQFDNFIFKNWKIEDNRHEENLKDTRRAVNTLLPWYMVRAKILAGLKINLKEEHNLAELLSDKVGYNSYKSYDPLPFEITKAKFQNILLCNSDHNSEYDAFVDQYKKNQFKIAFTDNFYFLRVSCRNNKFLKLSDYIENNCYASLTTHDYQESPETRSENFIKLSRAVLNVSREDAAIYFDKALNKAIDFGEEGVIRWEALSSLAKRSSQANESYPELAHRYMRCAEMIGDTLDREKYWNRNDAVSTCFQLSPESTFPILYRWKDRKVGWHDRQINALAHSSIDSGLITPSSLWALSAFNWEYGLDEFLEKCLLKESNKQNRQQMLNHYIRDLRIKGHTGKIWTNIQNLAQKYDLAALSKDEFRYLVAEDCEDSCSNSLLNINQKDNDEDYSSWNSLYGQFDLLTDHGFTTAYQYFDSQDVTKRNNKFWQGCFNKITSRRLGAFLNIIIHSELLDFWDIQDVFKNIPEEWKHKATVNKHWNLAVQHVAARFPHRFTSIYERNYILGGFLLNDDTNRAIEQGIYNGLSHSVDIESPHALFSFAHFQANKLSMAQAKDLLDFGLSRLEVYLEPDYADGTWDKTNNLPKTVSQALIYYVYANLGSPSSKERWRAVHTIIRFFDLNCQNEINQLIDCYSNHLLSVYIPSGYAFYDLHAKLYLLVALTRCVHKSPTILVNHKNLFASIAIDDKQGVLFQYYAKQICLALINHNSNIFDKELTKKVQQACVTQYPVITENIYQYNIDTPWHQANTLGTLPDVWFAYDFDRYWFEPLGRVFGIRAQQVEDLAKFVLQNKWQKSFKSSYIEDSRSGLWKNSRGHQDTYHSHDSYPKVDSYSFYISYHLLLEVASMLLNSMPVVQDSYSNINSWDDWLNRHLILSYNDILLSEHRDFMPLEKPKWLLNYKENKDWLWQIDEKDFIDNLITICEGLTWLNVDGSLNYYTNSQHEQISYSSVLVPKHLSQSLLNTTINFVDHSYECHLSYFCESEYGTSKVGEFHCKQWLIKEGEGNSIEENDPFVGNISTQLYKLKRIVTEKIEIKELNHAKSYSLLTNNDLCFQNNYWSEDRSDDLDKSINSGHTALASLNFLKILCNTLDMDIAIQVNIKRTLREKYYRDQNYENKFNHLPRYSKTFILSGNGRLRDTRKNYQLR